MTKDMRPEGSNPEGCNSNSSNSEGELTHCENGSSSDRPLDETLDLMWNRPEPDIEDAIDPDISGVFSGIIWDLEDLHSVINTLGKRDFEAFQQFLARWVTIVFVIWTIAGLADLLIRNNAWLLVTDVGPGALFQMVMYHYFGKKRDSEKKDDVQKDRPS